MTKKVEIIVNVVNNNNASKAKIDELIIRSATKFVVTKIIELIISPMPGQENNTLFRGFQHIKVDARFTSETEFNTKVCLDPKCLITLGNRTLLYKSIPNFKQRIYKQTTPVLV